MKSKMVNKVVPITKDMDKWLKSKKKSTGVSGNQVVRNLIANAMKKEKK